MKRISIGNISRIKAISYFGLPPKGSLFRINPDYYVPDVSVLFKDHKWYLLDNGLVDALYNEVDFISGIYQANLYQSTDPMDNNNIVVVNYSQTGTALFDAVDMAKGMWVERVQGSGVVFRPYPQMNKLPVWDESFEDLLNVRLSQCGQFIDDINHPYIEGVLQKTGAYA
jgi:hypothetical protein